MPYCAICGDPITKRSNFCPNCGTDSSEQLRRNTYGATSNTGERYVAGDGQPSTWIPTQRRSDRTAAVGPMAGAVRRVVLEISPSQLRAEFTIGMSEELIVGRDASACALSLDDKKASRQHCAIGCDPTGAIYVRDLGSSNGTVADGTPVTGTTQLRQGSIVQIGGSSLAVVTLA